MTGRTGAVLAVRPKGPRLVLPGGLWLSQCRAHGHFPSPCPIATGTFTPHEKVRHCHRKIGLGVRFRNIWNGHWWVHVRFCVVRCEAIL